MESLTLPELRRYLRDLFALATLPAVWAGADARKLAATLGEALAQALDADVVYVLVDGGIEQHLDIRLPCTGEQARLDAQRALRSLTAGGAGCRTCELLGTNINVVVDMIDLRAEQGAVVVGARRAAFPSETERALLRVAVNQASVALETVGHVAELRRLVATKQALAADLEGASRRKDEFLAMLGHELRNPLAAIYAAHEQRVAAHDAGRADRIIGAQLVTLRRLVDDLLDVSRIATGKLVLKEGIVDVQEALSRALVACEHAATEKRIELSARLGDAPLMVKGDAVRLEQVFVNVVGNAVRYTPAAGHVSVDVSSSSGEDVVVTVSDNGCGVPADLMPRIFDPFVQAETSLHREHAGLGLGLALAKGIVDLHGGSIGIASEGVGKGCTVEIRFQRVAARGEFDPPSRIKDRATLRAGRRVLLVDDNADMTEMFAEALEDVGHATARASDGVQALHVAESFSPDVAFVDIGLPGLDGHEVARRLRARAGRRLVLVAMSGYGQPEDVARSREAGFDHHLVKPVPIERIEELVAGCHDA